MCFPVVRVGSVVLGNRQRRSTANSANCDDNFDLRTRQRVPWPRRTDGGWFVHCLNDVWAPECGNTNAKWIRSERGKLKSERQRQARERSGGQSMRAFTE